MAVSDGTPPPSSPSVGRAVLLTAGAAALLFVLVGAGTAAYLAYDRQRDQLSEERSARNALSKQVADASKAIGDLRQQLESTGVASGEAVTGPDEGAQTQQGARSQRADRPRRERRAQRAFADFGTWELDRYYIVRLAKGTRKRQYEVSDRSLMKPCTAYHVQGHTVATRSEPCG
jgi:hypothetical protein